MPPSHAPHAPLQVGMIGVGRHARTILIPSIAQIPDQMRLIALATSRAETARAAESQFHLPTHVGYESLIADPSVEAVLVVGGKHGPEIVAALEAGKPVWTETPGINSTEDASRINALSQRAGLTVQVGSCLRYAPIYQRLRLLLTEWRAERPGPRTFAVRYFPFVGHFYNLLLYLGGQIASVCALTGPDGGSQTILLRFASGEIGSIAWQRFESNALPYERVEVSGANGLLAAEDGRTLRFHRTRPLADREDLGFDTSGGSVYDAGYSIPYGKNTQLYARGYVPELAHFVHCVRTGDPPICGVHDAAQTLLVRQAVERSAEAGGQWSDV